jgi:type II secretory pathway pseudopilin PulG
MPVFTKSAKPRLAAPRAGWRSAFSLAEVMVASCVLMLGISGALVTLRRSLDTIAQARQLDAASQLMQTELERLRLLNWSQLQTLQTSGQTAVDAPTGGDFARYTCERHIRDLRDGMKEITLVASWGGLDGRAHSARLITRYSRSGLNDYFYTTR